MSHIGYSDGVNQAPSSIVVLDEDNVIQVGTKLCTRVYAATRSTRMKLNMRAAPVNTQRVLNIFSSE